MVQLEHGFVDVDVHQIHRPGSKPAFLDCFQADEFYFVVPRVSDDSIKELRDT